MKYIIVCFLLSFPIVLMAQQKLKFEASSQAGYEYNISRNPISYTNSKGDIFGKKDMILSSPLVKIGLGMDYQKRIKKHIFDVDASVNYSLYPTLIKTSLLDIKVAPKYQYKFSKQLTLFAKGTFRYKHRGEIIDASNIHSIYSPYHQYGGGSGLQISPNKNQKIIIEAQQSWKNYHSTDDSSLAYGEFMTRAYFRQKFKKESTVSQFESSLSWKKRDYTSMSSSTGNSSIIDSDLLDDGINSSEVQNYQLHYITLNSAIKVRLGKNVYLKPSIEWTKRITKDRKSLNYNQYQTKLDFVYKKKNTYLKVRAGYGFRRYPNSPRNGNASLNYQYLRAGLALEQKIAKNLYFTAQLNATQRLSNFNDNTKKTNRGYIHGYGLVGIKVVF
jgi:hypothetical protein